MWLTPPTSGDEVSDKVDGRKATRIITVNVVSVVPQEEFPRKTKQAVIKKERGSD